MLATALDRDIKPLEDLCSYTRNTRKTNTATHPSVSSRARAVSNQQNPPTIHPPPIHRTICLERSFTLLSALSHSFTLPESPEHGTQGCSAHQHLPRATHRFLTVRPPSRPQPLASCAQPARGLGDYLGAGRKVSCQSPYLGGGTILPSGPTVGPAGMHTRSLNGVQGFISTCVVCVSVCAV